MRLLGNFPSQLSSAYYAGLLLQVNDRIAAGEYSGGDTFDAAAVAALQAQGQKFTSLVTPSAGSRLLDDSVNMPLDLIDVRMTALESEVENLHTTVATLASSLENQTNLLDQLLAYTKGSAWARSLPQLGGALSYSWDFGGGFGAITGEVPVTDPSTGVLCVEHPTLSTTFNTVTNQLQSGVMPPRSPRSFAPKNLAWTFATNGQSQTGYGQDWADLDVLEVQPRLIFSPIPTVHPQPGLDSSGSPVLKFSGSVAGGSVPIYVNVSFVMRNSQTTLTLPSPVTSTTSKILTPYRIEPENTVVRANGKVFIYGVDFNVTVGGSLSPILDVATGNSRLPADVLLTVNFEEYFPAYQCSVDQTSWGPVIMLDPEKPYTDGTLDYGFLGVTNLNGVSLFPLTNENGTPSGLYLELSGVPTDEMIYAVTTPAAAVYGVPASLLIDMARPAYMTGVALSPYTSFPQTLKQIICQGVTGASTVLWTGSVIVDRPMVITFPRVSVRSLRLDFVQEHYTFKQYQVASSDQLRRDTLASLQDVLPFNIRAIPPTPPALVDGALYSFGLESVAGVDWSSVTLPGVLVTGGYRIPGIPEIFRLDTSTQGSVDVWVYGDCYSTQGKVIGSVVPTTNASGTAIVVPLAMQGSNQPAQIAYTDFYLKLVLRSTDAMLSNFLLQVTHV